jgi:hypothetical protein
LRDLILIDNHQLNQVESQRVLQQLKVRMYSQFSVDIFAMLLNRVSTDAKSVGYLRVVMILCQQVNDFYLPFGKRVEFPFVQLSEILLPSYSAELVTKGGAFKACHFWLVVDNIMHLC